MKVRIFVPDTHFYQGFFKKSVKNPGDPESIRNPGDIKNVAIGQKKNRRENRK